MKKLLSILFGLIIVMSLPAAGSEGDYYSLSYARLSYVNGDVFVQRAGDLGYEEGVVNLALIAGDKLGSREGRAEIHLGNRNYLRLDRDTQLDLVELPKSGYDFFKLHLLSGRIFLRINYLGQEKDFEVHTPDASFYILEEGLYAFDVRENYETVFQVWDGSAEAAGETGSLLINAEESLVAVNGNLTQNPDGLYAGYAFDDSFAEWNRTRDAFHNRGVARSYLPAELYAYESELDYYGRWEYERPYGYVWVPRVYQSSWRPYWNGRWVWYPVIGWNWVSYEPWGWCVSHYGRWHWRIGLGWYWIPTRTWGPAWVHWYHGADYYGWCPLSYYNYPGMILNNRYYGRHYRNAYPAYSRALVMVRKDQLRARHISRVSLSRDQTRRLGRVSLSAKQPNYRRLSGAVVGNTKASRVLARSNVRKVARSYSTGPGSKTSIRRSARSAGNSAQISRKSGVSPLSRARTSGSVRTNSFGKASVSSSRSATSSRTVGRTSSSSRIKAYQSQGKSGANSRSISSVAGRSRASGSTTRSSARSSTAGRVRSSAGTQTGNVRTSKIKTYGSRSTARSSSVSRRAPLSQGNSARTRSSVQSGRSSSSRSGYPSSSTIRTKSSSRTASSSTGREYRSSSSSRVQRSNSRTSSARVQSYRSRSTGSSRSPQVSSRTSRSQTTSRRSAPTYRAPSRTTRAPSRSSSTVRRSSPSPRISAPRTSSRSASSVRRSSSPSRSSARQAPSRSSGRVSSSSRSSGGSKARVSRSSSRSSSGKAGKKK